MEGHKNPGRCMTPENLSGKIRQAHKKIDPYQMTALHYKQYSSPGTHSPSHWNQRLNILTAMPALNELYLTLSPACLT